MSNNPLFTTEDCQKLLDRLIKAEAGVKAALAPMDSGHPLAKATKDLMVVHDDIRERLQEQFAPAVPAAPAIDEIPADDLDRAAIEIEREAHTPKADFADVIKALFMWRDDPAERAKNSGQNDS